MKAITAGCSCHAHNGLLTRKGYEALDTADEQLYLDRVGSMSAFGDGDASFVWDDQLIDSQYRRFLEQLKEMTPDDREGEVYTSDYPRREDGWLEAG